MGYEERRYDLVHRMKSLTPGTFEDLALDVFRFQVDNNPIYAEFISHLTLPPLAEIYALSQVPFLPIEAFKHHPVKTGYWQEEQIFQSSGKVKSHHYIRSLSFYHHHALEIFSSRFGDVRQYEIFGLLPHYLQAGDSSLVSMVHAFMKASGQRDEHFFLSDLGALCRSLQGVKDRRPLLFGVSYALLDLAEKYPGQLPSETLVIETGGMKGRKEEWSKVDLLAYLDQALGAREICSEYGMTELLSQAYSVKNGHFIPPSSMQVRCHEINDPLTEAKAAKPGVVHIIDLANIDSCSFIATADLGRVHPDHSFEIMGRLDHSDLRGCQLLYI